MSLIQGAFERRIFARSHDTLLGTRRPEAPRAVQGSYRFIVTVNSIADANT